MQPYMSRVAESKEAMLQNNNTNGAKEIVYFKKPNGFCFSRNGAEFTEVVLTVTDKKTGVKSEKDLIMAELTRPDGTKTWDTMSMHNWTCLAHNADPIIGAVKAYKEGQNKRDAAKVEACKALVKSLKGANLSVLAIRKAAEAEGYKAEVVEEALKS